MPEFDGESPLITDRWLVFIEAQLPNDDYGDDERVRAAMSKLAGAAKSNIRHLLTTDWDEFKAAMLELYDPRDALNEIYAEITRGDRYRSCPSFDAAIRKPKTIVMPMPTSTGTLTAPSRVYSKLSSTCTRAASLQA